MEFKSDFPLKGFNTFGIDASCKEFVAVRTSQQFLDALDHCKGDALILGGGSNLLFENNINRSVIKNEIWGIEISKDQDGYVDVIVGGGENWDTLVRWAVEHGFGGIENLSLIPGNVGAAPIQNIGAYGVELESILIGLKAINLRTGDFRYFSANECQLGYRDSIFKREEKGKYAIIRVHIRLNRNPHLKLDYGNIKETIAAMGVDNPTIKDVRQAVIRIRQSKLPDPAILGNAGRPDLVYYTQGDAYKIPAGWLIDQCGWKGKRIGNVGCYEKQALIIVNHGGATGREVIDFAKNIQVDVKSKFGINLEPEVNIL
jgi:UDP-N-acetylmuramate dehydrogenase